MSMQSSLASGPARGIRVLLCEPDAAIRAQLKLVIASDPTLTLAAESADWSGCEQGLDELIPELLIASFDLIPVDWRTRTQHDYLSPVVIALRRSPGAAALGQPYYDLPMPADSESVRSSLNRAVRQVCDRKARQLLCLVEHYIAGSAASAVYKSVIRVDTEQRTIELRTNQIQSIKAARKRTFIHASEGDFMLREPIHAVAARLDPAIFIRIHRSVIVNRDYVARTISPAPKLLFVVLRDGTRYPIGPNYRNTLDDLLRSNAA